MNTLKIGAGIEIPLQADYLKQLATAKIEKVCCPFYFSLNPDWAHFDEALAHLKVQGFQPIVQLHAQQGFGDFLLLHPDGAENFLSYVQDFSSRYPWIQEYLFVGNTRGVFRSPHQEIHTALLAKTFLKATEILKKLSPGTNVIVMDQIGHIQGPAELAKEVEIENQKQWQFFDLMQTGAFDILSIMYHPSNDRYLLSSTEDLPQMEVDIGEPLPLSELLKTAWKKYSRPLALEIHTDEGRENQLRGLYETWECIRNLKREGLPIKDLYIERGTLSDPKIYRNHAKTLLTEMLKSLIVEQEYNHPLLKEEKWKKNFIRVKHMLASPLSCSVIKSTSSPILITGAGNILSGAFARICSRRNIPYILLSANQMDMADPVSVKKNLEKYVPWAVINTYEYFNIDKAETEIAHCFRANVVGPNLLAEECRKRKIQFLSFSSDYVFDGKNTSPYHEQDSTQPLNAYGRSKVAAENFILSTNPSALIIRSGAYFGPWDKENFLTRCFKSLVAQQPFFAPRDIYISPTYVPDLVNASLELLIDKESGVVHLANEGKMSWFELASLAHKQSGFNKHAFLISCTHDCLNFRARRPLNSSLVSDRIKSLPAVEQATFEYLKNRQHF
nr:NAD(P)-dependent oxidoreductase [uncultured Bdellovibrio sp.]